MLRVDEQEGSRAWCREEIERGEKQEGEEEKRVKRAKARLSRGQRLTEPVCKKTVPSVCWEDLCRTGLCVTVSEGPKAAKGMANGRRTGQDRTQQDRTVLGGSGQDSREGFPSCHSNRRGAFHRGRHHISIFFAKNVHHGT